MACASRSAEAPVTTQPAASSIPAVAGDTIEKSGLRYIDVFVGTGELAQRSRCVFTKYVGWLATGKVIDFVLDTTREGKPRDPMGFVIGQRQVIAGWEIGIEGMREGGYRRLLVPWRLGYGTAGSPPTIPSRADLVFDVELVKVTPARIGGSPTTPALECGPYTRGMNREL
jgi:FKBP-type peptidyl-prolyl cis-trans isomerase